MGLCGSALVQAFVRRFGRHFNSGTGNRLFQPVLQAGVTLGGMRLAPACFVLIGACTSKIPGDMESQGLSDDTESQVLSGDDSTVVDIPEDTGVLEPVGAIDLGPISTCDDPLPGPSYEEVGLSWGVDLQEFSPSAPFGHEDGPSIALGDANGDGHLELVIARQAGQPHFYIGSASGYSERPGFIPAGRSPLFADADADGDLDLIMGGIMPNVLYLDESLLGISVSLPELDPPGTDSASTVHDFALADFDMDGIEDILVVRTAVPHGSGVATNDRMLHLGPDGIEVEMDMIPEEVGLRHGFDGLPFDEDGDGDMDVYIVHDHGATIGASTLLRNDEGVFVDASDTCYCSLYVSGKGIDITDIDGDGQPDVLITGGPLNTLLSRKDGSWVDVSDSTEFRAVPADGTGWGGVFLDVDNDGQRDILLAQGDRWSPGMGGSTLPDGNPARFDVPLRLLRQDDGVFSDVGSQLAINVEGSFRAVVATDLNRDGVEDLVITQASERTLVFASTGCTEANWIEVEAPLGSRITVNSATRSQTDWVRADRGLQATARVPMHFGLGADATVDSIVVNLPGGDKLVAVGPIDARRLVTLSR